MRRKTKSFAGPGSGGFDSPFELTQEIFDFLASLLLDFFRFGSFLGRNLSCHRSHSFRRLASSLSASASSSRRELQLAGDAGYFGIAMSAAPGYHPRRSISHAEGTGQCGLLSLPPGRRWRRITMNRRSQPPTAVRTPSCRNVLDHLTDEQKPSVAKKLNAAYAIGDYAAKLTLTQLHRELMDLNPSAARSLEEGLEETLTVHRLHLPPQLRKSLASTNVIESAFSIVERVCLNVKRWHRGDQRERWVESGLLWRRNNSAESKDINRFLSFSKNWKRSLPLSRRLSNVGRRRKVGCARGATFNGNSDNPYFDSRLVFPHPSRAFAGFV